MLFPGFLSSLSLISLLVPGSSQQFREFFETERERNGENESRVQVTFHYPSFSLLFLFTVKSSQRVERRIDEREDKLMRDYTTTGSY